MHVWTGNNPYGKVKQKSDVISGYTYNPVIFECNNISSDPPV